MRCGGPVVVDAESVHPGGVTVQHGRCPVCGIALRRLPDAARLPLSDVRGGWTAADVFAPTVAGRAGAARGAHAGQGPHREDATAAPAPPGEFPIGPAGVRPGVIGSRRIAVSAGRQRPGVRSRPRSHRTRQAVAGALRRIQVSRQLSSNRGTPRFRQFQYDADRHGVDKPAM